MNGAIFFDRDGVLNEDVGYLHRVADFRWTPGARRAVGQVRAAGLLAIVVTNQSGVARGLYSEADVGRLHAWMQADLAENGIEITAFYTCPYHAEAVETRYRIVDHPDRKPNPGMILRALADWRIDPRRAVIIGDKPTDLIAGERAGIATAAYRGGDLTDVVAPWIARFAAR